MQQSNKGGGLTEIGELKFAFFKILEITEKNNRMKLMAIQAYCPLIYFFGTWCVFYHKCIGFKGIIGSVGVYVNLIC